MSRALSLHVHDVAEDSGVSLAGVNRKDRHVAALAIAQQADGVVTNDRRLRREINALALPLRAITVDEFVVQLVTDARARVDEVITQLVSKRTRRPITRKTLIDQLTEAFPRLAAELSPPDR